MSKDQPREERYQCLGKATLFIADQNDQTAMSKRLQGQLLDISSSGASLALAEIIIDRRHLAYAPMESDRYKLHIVLNLDDEELITPVKPTWFNKKLTEEVLPFRIGIEFLTLLTSEQLKKIRYP